jgi:hypothetical protein
VSGPRGASRDDNGHLPGQGQILTSMFFARALAVRNNHVTFAPLSAAVALPNRMSQASHPLPSKCMQQRSWARGIFLPPGPPAEGSKIGFTTYAMWGLCAVVVGVCYVLEQNEAPCKSSSLPVDVQRVLPSGAYLMSARCALVQKRRAPTLLSMLTALCESRGSIFGSCAQRMAACASRWLRSGRDGFEAPRTSSRHPTALRTRERLESHIYSLSGDLSCRTGSRSG